MQTSQTPLHSADKLANRQITPDTNSSKSRKRKLGDVQINNHPAYQSNSNQINGSVRVAAQQMRGSMASSQSNGAGTTKEMK